MENKNKSNTKENNNTQDGRGFSSMPHEKVQQIASKGGHASSKGGPTTKAKNETMAGRGRSGGRSSGNTKK